MKIVIPTNGKQGLSETTAQHFGRCSTYTFLDEIGNVVEILDNTGSHMGGNKLPPEIMKDHGADVLLCKGLGPNAVNLCKKLGIIVYVGTASTVQEMFDAWKQNELKKASVEDACEDHQK